jgi:hypothetical protein
MPKLDPSSAVQIVLNGIALVDGNSNARALSAASV